MRSAHGMPEKGCSNRPLFAGCHILRLQCERRGKGQLAPQQSAPDPRDLVLVNIYEAGPLEGRLEQWPVLAIAGALEVRLAETDHEVELAQRLRYHVFYEEMSAIPTPEMRAERRDFDKFDDVCDHLLVVDRSAHDDDGQP